ncbi:group I truncated hemoglobin [Roseateles amylovorans]|uniref:Group 1 truncated hemoglobin n=1 Tax=Roseateles amylovorans TaxID=2978473 RepID=A0ABY6AZE6_9BURK|nr:group 1 truncated hemoglobin [Roseateles amylovorans]UXH78062.1 group 1 truncated hemoglobin [Roseateles amylovorans]
MSHVALALSRLGRRRMMALSLAVALALGLGLSAGPVSAQDDLYRALGGEDGVRRISAELVQRVYADDRIKHLFQETNPKFLTEQLRKQFCELSGGPCQYDGESMKNSHAKLGITKAHFNALVEDLQSAMDAQGVPFTTQNRLLALLAPMHRDIVTR